MHEPDDVDADQNGDERQPRGGDVTSGDRGELGAVSLERVSGRWSVLVSAMMGV